MADAAVKAISDQMGVRLAELSRFIEMSGASDPRIAIATAALMKLNEMLQELETPPKPVKAPAAKAK